MTDLDMQTDQGSRERKAGEARGPKISRLMWIFGGVLVALGIFNLALLIRPGIHGSKHETSVYVFPPGPGPVLTSYDLVNESITTFSLRQPFYTPVEESLQEGDVLHVTVAGEGIWRQIPDPTQTVFHQTFRLNPAGPTAVVTPKGDKAIPGGRVNAPADLPSGYRKSDFPHQTAVMAALVGVVGRAQYDHDGMMVRCKEHFMIGEDRWLRIDGAPTPDTRLLLTLNLRWKETSWQYNEGAFLVKVQRFRPRVEQSAR